MLMPPVLRRLMSLILRSIFKEQPCLKTDTMQMFMKWWSQLPFYVFLHFLRICSSCSTMRSHPWHTSVLWCGWFAVICLFTMWKWSWKKANPSWRRHRSYGGADRRSLTLNPNRTLSWFSPSAASRELFHIFLSHLSLLFVFLRIDQLLRLVILYYYE